VSALSSLPALPHSLEAPAAGVNRIAPEKSVKELVLD
jgi:hypothetical protein